jgi:hypothetical protein
MPTVDRQTFDAMSPQDKQATMQKRIPIVDSTETKEIDISQVISILSRGLEDE